MFCSFNGLYMLFGYRKSLPIFLNARSFRYLNPSSYILHTSLFLGGGLFIAVYELYGVEKGGDVDDLEENRDANEEKESDGEGECDDRVEPFSDGIDNVVLNNDGDCSGGGEELYCEGPPLDLFLLSALFSLTSVIVSVHEP